MKVSDKYCRRCNWFEKAGKSISIKGTKVKGYCPFVRCVERYGFKSEQEKLQESIGGIR